jgi:hypothetical protein
VIGGALVDDDQGAGGAVQDDTNSRGGKRGILPRAVHQGDDFGTPSVCGLCSQMCPQVGELVSSRGVQAGDLAREGQGRGHPEKEETARITSGFLQ